VRPYRYGFVVSFQDTNLVGNVYFSQYFGWQGKCREHFLKDHAPNVLDYFKAGFGMVTKDSECRFVREAFVFDHILIEMFLEDLSRVGVRMRFDYYRQGPEGKLLLAQGSQAVAWVNSDHRVTVMPEYLYEAVRAFSEGADAEDEGRAPMVAAAAPPP